MLVYSWIKLKAYITNLFLFRGKRKKFYVPIEHVIQQAFIGIFRINSLGTWWDILYPFYRYYSVEIDFKSLYGGFCEKIYVNRYFYNKVFCSVVSAEWIFQSFDERWLIADIRVCKSFSLTLLTFSFAWLRNKKQPIIFLFAQSLTKTSLFCTNCWISSCKIHPNTLLGNWIPLFYFKDIALICVNQ